MKIPEEIFDAAVYFMVASVDRDEAYKKDETDKAFEIECEQRGYGYDIASWIIFQKGEKE